MASDDTAAGLTSSLAKLGKVAALRPHSLGKTELDQGDCQELHLAHITNVDDKEKNSFKSTCENEIQTRGHTLKKGSHHRKFLLFFQRKSPCGCKESEAKQSGEGKGMASEAKDSRTRQLEKRVDEETVCSVSSKSDAGSESEKKGRAPCFSLNILLCLKTPQKKSRDNRQFTPAELVKQSKGSILTGWRKGWSGIRSKRKEGNPQIQSLKKAPAKRQSTQEQEVTRSENTGEGLQRIGGERKHNCNTPKQWEQKGGTLDISLETSMVTSTTERNTEELVVLAHTKQGAAGSEGVFKSRKYMKMKSWRTVPFMTDSESECRQNEAPSEEDSESTVLDSTPISESSDDLDRRAQVSKPYSKLSFFRKIRQYNRLHKTAKVLNANTECESVYEDKHASNEASSKGAIRVEIASKFTISSNNSLATHIVETTAPSTRNNAATLADLSTADPMVSQNDDTTAEAEGPKVCEDVTVVGLTVDWEVADLAATVVCHKEVTGAGIMISQADFSAPHFMGTMESQTSVTVAEPMAEPEIVTVPQTAGVMVLQGNVNTEKPEHLFTAQKDFTASMTGSHTASEDHGIPKALSGSLITREDGTAAKVSGPVISHHMVTEKNTASPITSHVDVPPLSQEDAINTKVTGSLGYQDNATATNVSDHTESWNITLEQVILPLDNKVESVKDVGSGNKTSDGTKVISGSKHISREKQAQVSPSHSLSCDSMQYSLENKTEEINNCVTEMFMGACEITEPKSNCKMLAMYKDVHDMKHPLVPAHSDSGDPNECKALVNTEAPARVNHADRGRVKSRDSQQESVQGDGKASTSCGLFADLHLQDTSLSSNKRVQDPSHFPNDNLMQEGYVNMTQIAAISLASCPEFNGGNESANQNGWDAPPPSCVHPSSQETTHKDFAEILECCGRKDQEAPSAHVMSDAAFECSSVQILSGEGARQKLESASGEDMQKDNRKTTSGDGQVHTGDFHKILHDSPTSCTSNKTNQDEDDMFEGSMTHQDFRPEGKDRSPARMKSVGNIMAGAVDVTSLEKNLQPGRGPQNASRQTSPITNEGSDLSVDSHESEKRFLHETAAEIVQTAIQAATGHLAKLQQGQDWDWDFHVS
ncbi:uncharacterized protein LOC144783059 [Lissotriton helveticus]